MNVIEVKLISIYGLKDKLFYTEKLLKVVSKSI